MTEYFIRIEGRRNGPLSEEQIRKSILSGMVTPETQLWKPGMEFWAPVKEIPEMFNIFPELTDEEVVNRPFRYIDIYLGDFAGFGARFLSFSIDALIIFVPGYFANSYYQFSWIGIVFLYFAVLTSHPCGGRTLGDRAVGIKTISIVSGRPASIFQSAAFSISLILFGWVGWIWSIFDSRGRMLHNIFSKTFTIPHE